MSISNALQLKVAPAEASIHCIWEALKKLETIQKVALFTSSCTFSLFISLQYYLLRLYSKYIKRVRTEDDTKLSLSLCENFFQVARIALPTWRCKEFAGIILFISLFALKAIARVQLSKVNGQVLASMIHGNDNDRVTNFIQRISMRVCLALTLALSNGAIEGLRPWLIATFRKRLVSTFQRRFYRRLIFYQATVLDHRLEAVDTALATYCGEFAEHFAELPYYFVLPGLECLTASYALIQQSGVQTASVMGAVMTILVLSLRWLSPRFGRIRAVLLSREDDYRRMLTSNLYNVENIAMYGSATYTRRRLEISLAKLKNALDHMALARGNYATLETLFESMLSVIANIAAFDGTRRQYFKRPIDEVYLEIQLLEELNCSVRDFVVNFRELSHLTEFSAKMVEFDSTLRSITEGVFMRDELSAADAEKNVLSPTDAQLELHHHNGQITNANASNEHHNKLDANTILSPTSSPRVYTNICIVDHPTVDSDGNVELISVRNVMLESPSGQVLLRNLNFTMKSNEDWVITGVNGSGKTSFLRMLAGLWLPTSGKVCVAREVELLFAPQHSYMVPQCTLYEQICFPKEAREVNDEIRKHVMESLDLAGAQTVVTVIGGEDSPIMGFNSKCVDETYDWSSLSGGQKQRISMARIFFHVLRADRHKVTPIAILDEATSMMDETEQDVLNNLRRLDVRMLSVTHRETVCRHHTNVLRIIHDGNWMHEKVVNPVKVGELVELPEISYEHEINAHTDHAS